MDFSLLFRRWRNLGLPPNDLILLRSKRPCRSEAAVFRASRYSWEVQALRLQVSSTWQGDFGSNSRQLSLKTPPIFSVEVLPRLHFDPHSEPKKS